MRKYCILFTFLGILFTACSKKNYTSEFLPKEKFPQTWFGIWSGELNIYSPQGVKQTIPMELEIGPTNQEDVFIWAITYGEDKVNGRRSYELKVINVEQGLYVIDEKNTIELESYLYHNRFISRFEVQGNLLICTYEKRKEEIVFEVIAGAHQPGITSGGETFEGNEIPVVQSYPISVSQRAFLKKN